MDSGFQLLDSSSFSVEFGLRIPVVCGIPDSYSCILGSKVQDSAWIPQAKIFKIPDSTSRNFPVSEIRIPLLGAIPLHLINCCAAVLILSTLYMKFLLYMYLKFLKKEKH